jgi:hypothetical protein
MNLLAGVYADELIFWARLRFLLVAVIGSGISYNSVGIFSKYIYLQN